MLVTGGAGSFGKAFVRHALELGAERVRIVSRDEAKHAAMREEFCDDTRLRFLVGDVRDKDRLTRAMQDVEIVVHASALKRVEVAEFDADECAKTNVGGTQNVIAAATDAGVQKVVTLSTDKACEPINAYGASKLLAEKLTLAANDARGSHGPIFAVTRYGNVAGSRGSVIPTWRLQVQAGLPIRLTNPDVTRFWMGMDEAVALVVWTLATMRGGEMVVPSLPAYRLGDLAEAIGGAVESMPARSGEKVHESMIGPHEVGGFECVGDYYVRRLHVTPAHPLTTPVTSDTARRMDVTELREQLQVTT